MGSDGRLIYYSTIHLNRREEILIQSIISLYNSKDNYKWIYRETGDDISAIVVGSEAKALIGSGNDPYMALESRHIVIMLGDLFYPKNARALVRIGLPIKALDLVDKLGYIERSIISKPVSVEYIATNVAVAIKEVQASVAKNDILPPNKDESIEFVVRKPIVETKKLDSSEENTVSNFEEPKFVTHGVVKEEIVSTNFSLKNASVPTDVNNLNSDKIEPPQETSESKDIELDNFPNVKFTFSEDKLGTEDLLTPLSLQNEATGLALKETFDYMSPKAESGISIVKPAAMGADEKSSVDLRDTIDYIPPNAKVPTINKNVDAPTLTEVVPKHLLRSTNVVPLYTNNIRPAPVSGVNTMAQASQSAISEEEVTVIATSSVASLAMANEQPQCVSEVDANFEVSKRIKLLRWPKSDIIQRHPGNAILASMVINIPMSVEDMAKQSDLPLLICKNFVDAVIDSNVATYVDLPEMVNQSMPLEPNSEPIADQQEEVKPQEEKKVKRKGILYRIRAALGLLRK